MANDWLKAENTGYQASNGESQEESLVYIAALPPGSGSGQFSVTLNTGEWLKDFCPVHPRCISTRSLFSKEDITKIMRNSKWSWGCENHRMLGLLTTVCFTPLCSSERNLKRSFACTKQGEEQKWHSAFVLHGAVKRQRAPWAVGVAPLSSFLGTTLSISSSHYSFELCLWESMLYLDLFCAKVTASLLYVISAFRRFHRKVLFSDSQCLVAQSCLTLCKPRFLCPWGFSRQVYWGVLPSSSPGYLPNPGIKHRSSAFWADYLLSEPPGKPKNTGVWGSLSFLQGIFLSQESNWELLRCRWILYQ